MPVDMDGWTTDPPRVICSDPGCSTELLADPRHIDNLIAAKWRCGLCVRGYLPEVPC